MTVDTSKTQQAIQNLTPQQTLQQLIEKSTKEFKRALPVHMRPERLVRIALTCIRTTPELVQCTPASFVGALLASAQLGLEPINGQAYLLPFFNSKTGRKEVQFIVGYKGLANLFYRHEKSVQLAWGTVRENDEFDFQYGTNAYLKHRPTMKSPGNTVGYYVIAELKGGAKPFLYMSAEECMEHGRQHSKTYDQKTKQFSSYSPWSTEPDAMCKKTVLIQLGKLLPLSVELQQAIQTDETSREYREGLDSALDIPAQDWQEEKIEPAPQIPQTNGAVKERPKVTALDIKIHDLKKQLKNDEAYYNILGKEFGVEHMTELTGEQKVKFAEMLAKEIKIRS